MSREPLAFRGLIVAAVTAVLNLAVWFGWELNTESQAAITAVSGSLAALVVTFWGRGSVTPVDSPEDADGVLVPEGEVVDVALSMLDHEEFVQIDPEEWR